MVTTVGLVVIIDVIDTVSVLFTMSHAAVLLPISLRVAVL